MAIQVSTGFKVQEANFTKDSDAASTDQEIVAAPGAGKRLVVVRVTLRNSAAAAITAIFEEGSTQHGPKFWLAASGGDDVETLWKFAANTALTLTTTGASDHSVSVHYYVEASS